MKVFEHCKWGSLSALGAESHLNLTHHSDRGIQYCSHTYVKLLQDYDIKISMTENGDPLENAIAEKINGNVCGNFMSSTKLHNNICPNSAKYPIFNGVFSGREMTSKAYSTQFCEGGDDKWNNCKRFMTKQHCGSCPSDLLPNSSLTIEQIAAKFHLMFQS